jgi:hypothetical protein
VTGGYRACVRSSLVCFDRCAIARTIALLLWLERLALRAFEWKEIPMLVLALGLVLTAVLVKLGYRGGGNATDLGSMSHQWIAAYRASQHASSQ